MSFFSHLKIYRPCSTEWNKSEREKQIPYYVLMHVYMESREMVLMSPLQGGSGDAGVQVGLVDTGRAGRGRMETVHTAEIYLGEEVRF